MATLLYVRTSNGGTGAAVQLKDLGIIIPTGTSWTLLSASDVDEALGSPGQFSARELRDSQDLFDAIRGGLLEWSKDGSTVETAASYVADYMLLEDLTDDSPTFNSLTVTNTLTTSGLLVNGNNHFDGGPNKHNASEIYVEGTYTNFTSPSDLETVLGGIDSALSASSNAFTSIVGDTGSASADSSADTLTFSGVAGIAVTVTDTSGNARVSVDGTNLLPRDGSRPMTGALDMGTNNITNVGTVDGRDVSADGAALDAHLDGGANKHDGSEIDVEGTYANIPGSPGDLETVISGINTKLGTIVTDHGDLTGLSDDDHTQYALLAGTSARNAVTGEFDFTGGDLRLPVDVSAPTGASGRVSIIDGILYTYDSTRAKWLSVERKMLWASKAGSAKNVYLRVGEVSTLQTGMRMPRDGTITALVVQTRDPETWTLEIRRNGVTTPIASLAISAATGAHDTAVNVDFTAGDIIQVYANTAGTTIRAPVAGLEIAWRA